MAKHVQLKMEDQKLSHARSTQELSTPPLLELGQNSPADRSAQMPS